VFSRWEKEPQPSVVSQLRSSERGPIAFSKQPMNSSVANGEFSILWYHCNTIVVAVDRPSMKQAADLRMEIAFNVIVERDEEGYYVASVPELRGCHTQARFLDTLMERIKEAIDLCLEEQGRLSSSNEFVGVKRVTVEL
jgi:predicted RNase H-like HicB family nuclease